MARLFIHYSRAKLMSYNNYLSIFNLGTKRGVQIVFGVRDYMASSAY